MRTRRMIITVLIAMAGFFAIQLPGAVPASATTTTFQDTDTGTGQNQVQYTGASWTHCGGCSVPTDDSSYYYGYTVGDSYTLRFTGTQLQVYAPTDTNGGIADVTVDGTAAGSVDFHTTGTPADGLRWTSATLTSAAHTVVFTISSATNSTQHVALFDKAVASDNPAPPPTTTFQDTAVGTGQNQVQYTGASWTHCGGCSVPTDDSSYYYGYTVGDSYTLRFTGTQLQVYAPTDTNGGIADVTVDGTAAGSVDFHTTGTPADGLRWTSATLTSAAHTVVFTISSATNSTQHVVLFDKAVVDGSGGSPAISGLLGAGVADPYEFGSWLGKSLQVWETWNNFPDWASMEGIPSVHQYFTGEGTAPFNVRFPGRLSFSQPLFAQSETTANCSGGGDDSHYTAIATALNNAGFGNAIIRLGWEQNGDWFWWHATTANASAWASCFQHAYTAFKAVNSNFVMEWNPNKSTDMSGFDTRTSYPGDAYVDVIGVDYYDQFPAYPDQSAWDADYSATENGGSPTGIGSWISYASSHGKQIAFPEWGLNTQNDPANPDNAFFIGKMADTFAGLGTSLFEQSIFTLLASSPTPTCNFAVHVGGCNPNATAAYLSRFGS